MTEIELWPFKFKQRRQMRHLTDPRHKYILVTTWSQSRGSGEAAAIVARWLRRVVPGAALGPDFEWLVEQGAVARALQRTPRVVTRRKEQLGLWAFVEQSGSVGVLHGSHKVVDAERRRRISRVDLLDRERLRDRAGRESRRAAQALDLQSTRRLEREREREREREILEQ